MQRFWIRLLVQTIKSRTACLIKGKFAYANFPVCGNQQEEGVHYNSGDLYAPVMKASEVRLALNLAARENLNVYKTDTKQAFLNAEMGDEVIYIRAPDWLPEQVPYGHVLQLKHVLNSSSRQTMARANLIMDGRT